MLTENLAAVVLPPSQRILARERRRQVHVAIQIKVGRGRVEHAPKPGIDIVAAEGLAAVVLIPGQQAAAPIRRPQHIQVAILIQVGWVRIHCCRQAAIQHVAGKNLCSIVFPPTDRWIARPQHIHISILIQIHCLSPIGGHRYIIDVLDSPKITQPIIGPPDRIPRPLQRAQDIHIQVAIHVCRPHTARVAAVDQLVIRKIERPIVLEPARPALAGSPQQIQVAIPFQVGRIHRARIAKIARRHVQAEVLRPIVLPPEKLVPLVRGSQDIQIAILVQVYHPPIFRRRDLRLQQVLNELWQERKSASHPHIQASAKQYYSHHQHGHHLAVSHTPSTSLRGINHRYRWKNFIRVHLRFKKSLHPYILLTSGFIPYLT